MLSNRRAPRAAFAWSLSVLLVAVVFGPLCPVLGACPMQAAEAGHCGMEGMGSMAMGPTAGPHEMTGMGSPAPGSEGSHECCDGPAEAERSSGHSMDCCGGDGLPTSVSGERGPTVPLALAATPVAMPVAPAALDGAVGPAAAPPTPPPEGGLYTLHSSFLI